MSRKQKKKKHGAGSLLLLWCLLIATLVCFKLHDEGGSRSLECVPQEIIELGERNPDAKDFVRNYNKYYGKHQTIHLSKEAKKGKIPLLLQWDKRWGYEVYGSNVMGITGCGPTCLSMVALGLTGDSSYDPLTIARYAEENGYYSSGNGTEWALMREGCEHFGLSSKELPLVKKRMEEALDEGHPIILAMGAGDFTAKGHYIVLTGYDSEGFTVHDPNSPTRSERKWTFDELEGQIRNIWSFSRE